MKKNDLEMEILIKNIKEMDLTPEEIEQIIECQIKADKFNDLSEQIVDHRATVDELYEFIEECVKYIF